MQQVRGIYLPDWDIQVGPQIEVGPTFAGKGTFQLPKLMASMDHIHNFRHALDVGAHVGLWSRVLARMFGKLSAFEPLAMHRECFELNVPMDNKDCEVRLYDCALGEKTDIAKMTVKPNKSSTSRISPDGTEVVRIVKLDDLNLEEVDFIKIDTEGFETAVVLGGEYTIRHWKPTMIIEQKPGNAEEHGFKQYQATELLKSWGAEEKYNIGNDICLRWKKRFR